MTVMLVYTPRGMVLTKYISHSQGWKSSDKNDSHTKITLKNISIPD